MDRRRYARLVTLALLAAALVYLVGNGSVPLWDRDEPRYATASRYMAEHGDWIVPQFLGEPRTAKPILIYWLQASAMKVFGPTEFAARLPSAVSMTLTLALLAVALPSIVGRRRALWAVFILATSALTIATAKMSLTDATLLLFVTASQLCLYRTWLGRRDWPTFAGLGLSVGLAGLTKGPVVLAFCGCTLVALLVMKWIDRGRIATVPGRVPRVGIAGWLARGGLVVLLVMATLAPWLWLIEQRLPGYLLDTLHKEIFLRGTQAAEGHTGPPGFYLLTIWGTFLPWCLLLPAAIVLGWRRRSSPPLRFALAAVIGPWLFLEIYVTKLPHYLVSTFPFLAVLVADLIVRCRRRLLPDLATRAFRAATVAWRWAVLAIALAAWGLLLATPTPPVVLVGLLVMTAIVFELGRMAHRALHAGRMTIAALAMGVGAWLVVVVASGLILPHLGFLQVSPRVAGYLRADGATDQPDVRMVDYKEPSLGFYQGGSIREETDDQFLVNTPQSRWPRWLAITDEQFRKAPDEVQDRWTVLGAADGIAYADGMRRVCVLALRRRD